MRIFSIRDSINITIDLQTVKSWRHQYAIPKQISFLEIQYLFIEFKSSRTSSFLWWNDHKTPPKGNLEQPVWNRFFKIKSPNFSNVFYFKNLMWKYVFYIFFSIPFAKVIVYLVIGIYEQKSTWFLYSVFNWELIIGTKYTRMNTSLFNVPKIFCNHHFFKQPLKRVNNPHSSNNSSNSNSQIIRSRATSGFPFKNRTSFKIFAI